MGKLWIGESNGCWVDVFTGKRFRSNSRRLHGPADFPMLRIGEAGWGDEIQSLRVGPNTYVQMFEQRNFYGSVLWLLPNQTVEDLSKLRCGDQLHSARLWDRPPFAHEPGYAAYMLWAASHVAKAARAG